MRCFLAILLLFCGPAWAAPVLLFSDITSGPKTGLGDGLGSGAIVTLWGQGLGSSQGGSTVTIAGSTGGYVYEWGNATVHAGHPADLYTRHRMQVIMVSVPADAADGAGTISVTVGGVTSNTLPFTVRAGNIYWVSDSGSEANAGTYAAPWVDIGDGSNVHTDTSAGDIVYSLGTTKTGEQRWTSVSGTSGNPKALISYPGAVIQVTSSVSGSTAIKHFPYGESQYWVFSKISLITEGDGFAVFPYSRYTGNAVTDVSCAEGSGGSFTSGGNQNAVEILGNYVHDFGCATTSNQHHTLYFSVRNKGANIEPMTIRWNHLRDNQARFGIHFYDENPCWGYTGTTVIDSNWVENQVSPGFNMGGWACTSGYSIPGDFQITNNVFVNCGMVGDYATDPAAIMIQGKDVTGTYYIYNNTIVGSGYTGAPSNSGENAAIVVPGTGFASTDYILSGDWYYKNNIVTHAYSLPFTGAHTKTPLGHTNNLWYDSDETVTAPTWDTSPLTADPLFVGGSPYSYAIQSGSPAKNAGADLSATLTKDLLGVPRETFDIGAYEYAAGVGGGSIQFSVGSGTTTHNSAGSGSLTWQ